MRVRIGIVRAFVAIAISAATLGCRDDNTLDGPIILASVYNLTGFQAVLDVPSSNGSLLAASEINAHGGILGREVSLVAVEGESVPEALSVKTENLLDEHPDIVAFFGLSDTDMVLAAAPVAASHQRVFLSSGATSPKLPEQVPEFLFLACFGDNVQAAAGAEWAYGDLGAREALVLFDPSESYTELLQGYFVARFEELGGTITATESIDPRTDPITLPPTGNADLVFLSVQTAEDAARVIPLLRAAGYAGPILGGDGYDSESTWESNPNIADVYFTTHVYLGADSPNPLVTAFVDAYTQAYPGQSPSAFAALGYDAVNLLSAALERAGEATPAAVATGLSGLQGYNGVTGTMSFEGNDRIPTKSVTILRVANASQTFVAEVIPLSVPNP
jgi:branched-chain amino acid transport system substrate-binding protein